MEDHQRRLVMKNGNAISVKNVLSEAKAELMKCEYCDRQCLKLSLTKYKFLCKRKDFHWYYPNSGKVKL